jgi:hypothetical protein
VAVVVKRLGLFLLVLLLLPFSVILNAISGIEWSTDGKPNDVGDDGVEGRSWEWGMRNCFGLAGPAVLHCLSDLRAEPGRWKHHLKGILHVWIREYPKRASKLLSLALVVVLTWWLAGDWIAAMVSHLLAWLF